MAVERLDPQIAEHRVLFTEHVVRYAFASSYVRGKRVLDVGSGEGYGAGILKRAGAGAVIGVEIDAQVAARAHYRYLRDGMAFVNADGTRLPFADRSFDVVTCFEVIEHVNEPGQRGLLDEVRRVLRDDGMLIVSTPNRELYTPRVSEEVLGLNPFHLHELTFDDFREGLARRFARVTVVGQTPVPALLLPDDGPLRRDDLWHQAIGDTVYTINPLRGDVSIYARLDDPLAPELSLYMIAICGEQARGRRGGSSDDASISISRVELLVFALWARWKVSQQELLNWLREKNGSLERTVIERTDWGRSLEQSLARATISINGLENDLANLRTLLAAAEGRVGQRDGALHDLRTTVAQLEAAARESADYAGTLERSIERKDRHIEELEARARESADYAGALERSIERKDRHIEELEARARELEAAARESADYAGTLERSIERKDRHIEELEARIRHAARSLSAQISQRVGRLRKRQ